MRYFLAVLSCLIVTNVSAGILVEPELKGIIARYEAFAGITVDVDVLFSAPFMTQIQTAFDDTTILGICWEDEDTSAVVIDPDKWITLGERQQTALV